MNNLSHTPSPLSSPEIVLILMLTAFIAWAISGFISRLPMRGRATGLLQWATVWILEIIGGFAGLLSFVSVIVVSMATWHMPWYLAMPLGCVYVIAMEKVQISGKTRFEVISKRFSQVVAGQTPQKPLSASKQVVR